jgi:hypothetical protein
MSPSSVRMPRTGRPARHGRRTCSVLVGLALTWSLPSAALAIDVSLGSYPTPNTIFVAAAPGEDNALTIAQDAVAVRVTESNPPTMTAGAGCRVLPGNAASCPSAGVVQVHVTLGDGDDGVTLATAMTAVVLGGAGDDTLNGGRGEDTLLAGAGEDYVDGRRGIDRIDAGSGADVVVARDGAHDELVSCGPAEDLAIVDRADRVAQLGRTRCERVDDGTDKTPKPGWVYLHPRHCEGGGSELGLPAMHRLVPLRYAVLLPSGSGPRAAPTLDSTDCPVRLRATPGRGRSVFADLSGAAVTVGQSTGRLVTTTLTVERPSCAARRMSPAAVAREPRLRVKTDRRRGRWRVKGRFSIGAAFGTDWFTREGCSRTVTEVRRGRVRVFDRAKRRTVTVSASQRYVAQGRP